MLESGDRPLLTFAIAAFNQEQFIREAVEGAFAQTYSPLEIILSDDCSRDRTFHIMQEMAAAYRGPHRVVLNRNPSQQSIGGHVNRIVKIARGELILAAAGDDVSLPPRTQLVYDAWERSGRRATSIHSDITQIDEQGRVVEHVFQGGGAGEPGQFIPQPARPPDYVRTLHPLIFGCAHAFSPQLYRTFGDLPSEVIHEDNALGFRSVLAGQLLFINTPLVKYRVHGSNVYIRRRKRCQNLRALEREEDALRRGFRNRETMHRTFRLDLETARAKGLVDDSEFKEAAKEASRLQARFSMMGRFLDSGFFEKCRILSALRLDGLDGQDYRALFRRLIPRPLLLRIRLARGYVSLPCAQPS